MGFATELEKTQYMQVISEMVTHKATSILKKKNSLKSVAIGKSKLKLQRVIVFPWVEMH